MNRFREIISIIFTQSNKGWWWYFQLHGAEHSKCNHVITLAFKGYNDIIYNLGSWSVIVAFDVLLNKYGVTSETICFNPFKCGDVKGYISKCSGPYWSNPPFLISNIRALWCSGLSARVPECQKLQGGLDQYGAERFDKTHFCHNQKEVWDWKG